MPSSSDFPNDDDLFTSGKIPAEKIVQSLMDQSIGEVPLLDSPSPIPPVPLSSLVFVQDVIACSAQPMVPKNLIDVIPSPPTSGVATDTSVHCLSRKIAD